MSRPAPSPEIWDPYLGAAAHEIYCIVESIIFHPKGEGKHQRFLLPCADMLGRTHHHGIRGTVAQPSVLSFGVLICAIYVSV